MKKTDELTITHTACARIGKSASVLRAFDSVLHGPPLFEAFRKVSATNLPQSIFWVSNLDQGWFLFCSSRHFFIRNAALHQGTDDSEPLDPVDALQKIAECLKEEEDWKGTPIQDGAPQL